jgi:anti-sigma B factor antagonist
MPTRFLSSPLPPDDPAVTAGALCVNISRPDHGAVVITPVGEADLCTVAPLRRALTEAVDAGRRQVVVDLDQLTFMDARNLGVLVEARQRVSAVGGSFHVRCRNRHRRKVLSLTGLDRVLDHTA